jgi:hypothetical protein
MDNIKITLIRIIGVLLMRVRKFKDFAHDLGQRESCGEYTIVNSLGYMGKYQFGMMRLCDFGYTEKIGNQYQWKGGYSKAWFLSSPDVQELIFRQHCVDLKKQVMNRLSGYLDQEVQGIYITLSGLIAGAHLAGIGGVNRFLNGGSFQDGYGTYVEEYIQKFSFYNLDEL